MIHLDFETRSTLDLKLVGVYEYAAHPSTDIICMAWAIDDGPVSIWAPGLPAPNWPKGHLVSAWNAAFERNIWSHICQIRYGFEPIEFERWRCTMAKAAAMGLPQSLDMFARVTGLEAQKDESGKRVMLKLAKPKKAKEGPALFDDEAQWHECPKDLATVYEYCRQDVEVERQADRWMRDLSPRELRVWQLDQTINDRGLEVDRVLCANAVRIVNEAQEELALELQAITGGAVQAPTEVAKLKEWLELQGVQTPTLGANDVVALLKGNLPPAARRALEIRQIAGKSSTAKFEAMLVRSQAGRMRGNLRYHGAGPGRWSGMGAQIQNFPRGSVKKNRIGLLAELFREGDREALELFFGDPIEAAKSVLRSAIVAPAGRVLLVWDYAQIEARILAWLAGETQLVREFAQGSDVYRSFGSRLFSKPLERIDDAERFIAKTCVLGLGYGMGAAKLKATLAGYGTSIDDRFAKRCVDTYRATYQRIVKLWGSVERQAISANGMFRKWDKFLALILPSGREILYFDPQVKGEGERLKLTYKTTTGKSVFRDETYGGKLVENIVQGLARDVLVDGMFALTGAGFEIVATVHDEVIAESETDRLEEGIKLLTEPQAWAAGLPLAVEGFVAERYRK
jgi:DNA polymerase